MDIILVPGFWLDASSWSKVTPALVEAGHSVHPVTLPGLEAGDDIGLSDQVDAVVAAIDALGEAPVVLVGHSGGGPVIHGALDARPDRVQRAIYVDSGPGGEGQSINSSLPVVGDAVPLPDWDVFDDADLVDLTDDIRATMRADALLLPRRVPSDLQHLTNEKRFGVPVTVIACEFSGEQMREWVAQGHEWVADLVNITDVEYVDLPTGHWPQFTRPVELGEIVLAAVDRTAQKEYSALA